MPPKHPSLRTYLLAALGCAPGCGSPEDWPACGNDVEVTAESYGGVGSIDDPDFYVCAPLPEDGAACPDYRDVDGQALFEDNVGTSAEGNEGYSLRTACGPEPTRPDACCYVLDASMYVSYSGRPFVVGGRVRVATVVGGGGPRKGVSRVGGALRARLAEAWTATALAEHASVASFACFSLDLMALGAPPALLIGAARAQADEVVHARLAFGLASTYAGRPLAPGPLAGGGGRGDPVAVARALAREGCVGETVATALAIEALRGAEDPAVRRVLARIVADEARHAALAWRTARWLRAAFPETRGAFADALAKAVAGVLGGAGDVEGGVPDVGVVARGLRAHGVLPAEAAREVAARAVVEVVGPVARAA